MLVLIRMGTNMAAGNQQKRHLSLGFATKEKIYLSRNSSGVNRSMQILRFVPFFRQIRPSIHQYFCSNPKPQPHPETVYSCFEKGCQTKSYAAMPKSIMGNGVMVVDRSFRCFSDIEGNSINECVYAFSFLVG